MFIYSLQYLLRLHVELSKIKSVLYPLYTRINVMPVARLIVILMTDYGVQPKRISRGDIQEKRIGDIVKKKNVPLQRNVADRLYA